MWISLNDDSGVGLNEGANTGFYRFWVARQLKKARRQCKLGKEGESGESTIKFLNNTSH